jgi:hypothetical protein
MTRPRKDKPPSPVPDRVHEIRRRMATLNWNEHVRRELGEQWGLSDSRMCDLAGEASRSLRVDPEQLEGLRAQLAGALEEVVRHALEDKNDVTGQLDLRAATDAIEMLAKFRGVAPPEQAVTSAPVVIQIAPEWTGVFGEPGAATCPHCMGTGKVQTNDGTHARLMLGPKRDDDEPPKH